MTRYNISNRRYMGSKAKLVDWIYEEINAAYTNSGSDLTNAVFADVFAGTGAVAAKFAPHVRKVIVNDFLISNAVNFDAFFNGKNGTATEPVNWNGLENYEKEINHLLETNDAGKGFSTNWATIAYGDKFWGKETSTRIGFIREMIENDYKENAKISTVEYHILISSLLYSIDRIANTVGHYDAFRQGVAQRGEFKFELITPLEHNSLVEVHNMDANKLAPLLKANIIFLDPPYNSRQYDRNYHALDEIAKWKQPEVFGITAKPEANPETKSEYSTSNALKSFTELVDSVTSSEAGNYTKLIAVTYNNTDKEQNTKRANKISFNELKSLLEAHGKTIVLEHGHQAFQTGKTEFSDHKEFLFLCSV